MAAVEDFLRQIGDAVGLPLHGVKLLLCLVAGFPLGLVHRLIFARTSATIQHIVFTLIGLGIAYFCFGNDCIHSLVNIVIVYILLLGLGGTSLSVALGFIINLGYLLTGYYYCATDNYDIDWTTAHCVLTLKLIAVVFDRYDGSFDESQLSDEQKRHCLKETPSLLEMLGHAYFFGGFLVGPQISMKRYQNFVSGDLLRGASQSPFSSFLPGTIRILASFAYMGIFSVISNQGDPEYMLTPEFVRSPTWYRVIFPYLCVRVQFIRYVSAWMLAESGCMMSGISYNEKGTNFYSKWNAMANVRIRVLETACNVKQVIQSFNINTNRWGIRYIYKRLRFLRSTFLSQLALLYFLAAWHGLYFGYFIAFTIEMAVVFMENESMRILAILLGKEKISELPLFTRLWVNAYHFLRSFILMGMGFTGFSLKTLEKTIQAYKNIGIGPLVLLGAWIVWYIIFNAIAASKLRQEKAKAAKEKKN